MNEADPPPINLDELRLLPDWLREEGPPPSKQYAGHEGASADESGTRRGPRTSSMGRAPGGNRGFGGARGGNGGTGMARDRRRDGGGASRPVPGRRSAMDRPLRDEPRSESAAPYGPAPLGVEFSPDEKCMASITKQIRSTHMAYPLFGLARMFLQEPARHWVQLAVIPGAASGDLKLYQLGEEGPVTLDRAILERTAFDTVKDQYYTEQTEQKEPPKGNFTNVARNRLSGALLGPTNYHGYQPGLRAEYESRFSRRMSFEDYRRNIEVVNDPALVERWKEEARTTTTIATREGEPPTVLQSVSEARAHFRQHYFEKLLRSAGSFKVHGSVARHLPEPAVMQSIRQAHEAELRYPAQFVQLLRQGLQNAGLHIFKHRKRVVYVSLARPTPFAADGAVSENVAAILETVAQLPLCTRKVLAEHVLARKFGPAAKAASSAITTTGGVPTEPPPTVPSEIDQAPQTVATGEPAEVDAMKAEQASDVAGSVDLRAADAVPMEPAAPVAGTQMTASTEDPLAKAKAALAADLRFLVQAGHLIEFHNGTFDLPLPPKPKEEPPTATVKPALAGKAQGTSPKDEVPSGPIAADAEAIETVRAALPLEAVTILPPDAVRQSDLSPSLESGIEKTEADALTKPVHKDSPGIAAGEQQDTTPDAVVVGDAESPHPLSPS